MKLDIAKDVGAGHEMHFRAAALGFTGYFKRRYRGAITIFHLVRLAFAAYGQPQPF